MNKNLLLLLILILLGGAAYYLYTSSEGNNSSSKLGWDREFAVKNTDEIGTIYLQFRDGENVKLQREGDYWTYNDKYRASESKMKNLLSIIRNLQIKYKPADNAIPTLVKSLSNIGIKVEIFDKKDKKIKSYYVGGGTPDESGTYMILENAEQPYVCEIPIFVGALRVSYAIRGDNWRDRFVFRENPEDIDFVSIDYPKQRNNSFQLQRTSSGFDVTPFYKTTPKSKHPYRKGSAEQYLQFFDKVGIEAFENRYAGKDTIEQQMPFCRIILKKKSGHVKELALYPRGNKYAPTDNQVVERFIGILKEDENKDVILAQYLVFKKVLRGYDFFYGE